MLEGLFLHWQQQNLKSHAIRPTAVIDHSLNISLNPWPTSHSAYTKVIFNKPKCPYGRILNR